MWLQNVGHFVQASLCEMYSQGILRVHCSVFILQTPEWSNSDVCQKCSTPFFWNVKAMWEAKTVGVRQVRFCCGHDYTIADINCLWPGDAIWQESCKHISIRYSGQE